MMMMMMMKIKMVIIMMMMMVMLTEKVLRMKALSCLFARHCGTIFIC